ncbi:MAG: valine--tRNA ligase [Candidatus Aenigmarchaeota archaeon]|nr:valine--tRNA ligase [Candidatus Aenigmarchaeota archaeon]
MEFKPKITENRWNPGLEEKIRKTWNEEKIYVFNKNTKKKVFTIDTPPPYPSGRPWHIGAAAHYSQIDMIARTARMMGFEVFFPIGIDRNGLPVENYTEKKYNISIHETSREKFINLCVTALDDLEAEMIQIMKVMGLSGDFDNYYRTDSKEYRTLTQTTFIKLWDKGLIYEDTRPNNYCIKCGTTIADAEIEYEELPTELIYIKFKMKETGKDIIIATTRPELLCSCQAIIYNPKDERYKDLEGKHAIVPIFSKEVPILAHPYAKQEFGSGIVMICSYGDYSDVRMFRELKLKEIIAITPEGKMGKNAGNYAGLSIKDARNKIIQDLEKAGLIQKKENIMHRTPLCYRSKTPIEIIPMKEYYLKQIDFIPELLKIAKNMKFYPERHRQILIDWINSLTIDWPVSRRRYYGTEIPIWYCKNCKKACLPEPEKYYQPWKDNPPFKTCPHCKSEKGFEGETRTFDTWMDSSISPLFISKYGKDDDFFKKTFPAGIRPQAKDIIRTWLHYTILRCYQLTKKQAFEGAWIMGYGVDEEGKRMSKSKGNVVDPLPILEKYGGDIFRFWNASEAGLGSDFRYSNDKIESSAKFLTKLWNISRFISMFPEEKKAELTETDKWILSELNELIKKCIEGYESFDFFIPATALREFTWNLFASHYLEMAKSRAYGQGFDEEEQKAAWYTLHLVLKTLLKLFAPISPFITDYVWKELYGKESIHLESLSKPEWGFGLEKSTGKITEFNTEIWKTKKDKGLSLKTEIEVKIPKELKQFEKDLINMHNIRI